MNGNRQALAEGQPVDPATPGLGWDQVKNELLEFFASIKLAMFLFIVLAMTATIGTVIQQNERAEVYIQEYGEQAYQWFRLLGFTDVYHTWWFTSLLALLCINSLTCFHRRFPGIWRSMHQDKVNVTLPFIKNLKLSTEVPVGAQKDSVAQSLAKTLAERGYRVLARNTPEEATLYATKGIMGRVGAHVAHLSATVIVLGGLVGSVWGFQEFGVCLEGETYHIPKGNFDLRVDKFWIDYHDNGAVRSYNSTLTVLENDQPQMTKTITVNDPLVYKDIWFYQSSYGNAWDRVEVARVNIKDKRSDDVLRTVDIAWQEEKTLEDLGLTLSLTDFVADFGFNTAEKKVYSKSVEHENPAIKLAIWERDTVAATPWIFYHYPGLFDIQDSKYRFELIGYRPKQFTGLQISKDPGVTIVWVGSTLIVVGITLSSFIYHRRLWIKVLPDAEGRQAVVHLGGSSHKSQIDFQKEFRRITDRLRAITT